MRTLFKFQHLLNALSNAVQCYVVVNFLPQVVYIFLLFQLH